MQYGYNICRRFSNGLTTCVKPSSVQCNCCLKDHTSTDALLPNQLGSPHYETQDEFGTDVPFLHPPSDIPTSLCFPIAEAIWSHPGVAVASRGAAILAKWHSGLTTYNHSYFLEETKELDFIFIYQDVLMAF